jgi:hypothetical protein
MDAVTEVHIFDIGVSPPCLLEFGLMFLSESIEVADDETSIRAIVDKQTGSANPALQVV